MKTLSSNLKWITLGICLAASQNAAASCYAEKVIELDFDADNFTEMRLNALAGELYLEASDDNELSVRGVACADRHTYLERMSINVEEKGSTLELTVIIPYHEPDWHANYAYVDLTLKVPASLTHLIKDSSGDLEAHGIKLSMLNDSSGDIHLRDTTGDFSLRDSAGFVSVRDHKGDVELQDSSGDLDIVSVDGDVNVIRDSSGDIEIDTVSGTVTIGRDSSGDIEIDSVERDVEVGSDGSGKIKIRDVKGSVEIGSDGSGDIVVQRVGGDFVLSRKGSGDIRTAKIQGDIRIPQF